MRGNGRWAAALATVLVSMLASAISAGTAIAEGFPPYDGQTGEGGAGIHRGVLHQGSGDWTPVIVVVASIVAIGVILALSKPTRERNARSAGTVTPTVTR